MLRSFVKCKQTDGVKFSDFQYMRPRLMLVLSYISEYCKNNGMPLMITSLFTDYAGERVSKSHEDGRAFDMSIKNWPEREIDKFKKHMKQFNKYGAYSRSDFKQRLVVDHGKGDNRHLHIQVKP